MSVQNSTGFVNAWLYDLTLMLKICWILLDNVCIFPTIDCLICYPVEPERRPCLFVVILGFLLCHSASTRMHIDWYLCCYAVAKMKCACYFLWWWSVHFTFTYVEPCSIVLTYKVLFSREARLQGWNVYIYLKWVPGWLRWYEPTTTYSKPFDETGTETKKKRYTMCWRGWS